MKTPPIKHVPNPPTKMSNPAKGFLIDHSQFTDARPPRSRGASKSMGYPSFINKNS